MLAAILCTRRAPAGIVLLGDVIVATTTSMNATRSSTVIVRTATSLQPVRIAEKN